MTLGQSSRRRWRAGLCRVLAVSAALIFSGALSALSGQSPRTAPIPDEDKRKILALLFRQELAPRQDGEQVAVLLSPGVEPGWLPEVSGVSFRRLGYEEIKEVREYYDLMGFERHGEEIRVQLTRGNYCKKVGYIYRFRREGTEWRLYPGNLVESYAVGGSCPGCETGSGARYSVNALWPTPAKKAADEQKPGQDKPSLTGKVRAVVCRRGDGQRVDCRVDVGLEFSNNGARPLIILQPHDDYRFWHGATSLALTEADSRAAVNVYSRSAWPSFYSFPKYRRLAKRLDRPDPPAGVTRVLRPGEGWKWETSVTLNVGAVNSCDGSVGVEIGWEEIKRLGAPLWLRVAYETWPFNVENFKPGLGGKLRSRWARHGVLHLEEKSGRFWFATVVSEPIELDMRRVRIE